MKKKYLLILLLPFLFAGTAVVGTMWKQIGTVVFPADDVTEVDLSGIIVTGVVSNSFTNITVSDTAFMDTIEFIRTGTQTDPNLRHYSSSTSGLVFTPDGDIDYANGGDIKFTLSDEGFIGKFSGPFIYPAATGSANVVYSTFADQDTGIGFPALGQVSLAVDDLPILVAHTSAITFSRYSGLLGVNVLTIDGSGNISLTDIVVATNASVLAPNISALYNSTTIFQPITSFGTFTNTSGILPSLVTDDITIQSPGDYFYAVSVVIGSEAGSHLTLGVFANVTSNRSSTDITYDDTGHLHNPVLLNISTGTLASGTVADLVDEDGTQVIINEINLATPGFVFDLTYNGSVSNPSQVDLRGILYNGSAAHEVEIQQFNYVQGRYTGLRAEVMDFPDAGGTDAFRFYSRTFTIPQPRGDYSENDSAKTRIIHTSVGGTNHTFQLDEAGLVDDHTTNSISISGILRNLQAGDVIDLQHKTRDQSHLITIHNITFNLIKLEN